MNSIASSPRTPKSCTEFLTRMPLPRLPEDGGIECKHGAEECEGSIIELCAQDLYSDPRTSLGFAECLTSEYERIPDHALYEACASTHSIDMEAIDHCATKNNGAYGRKLLRESIQHSIDVRESDRPLLC